jgi:hypothetical protein
MAATEPPAPPPAILYVDTSALLKLLVREAESAAIERELLTWRELATSVIPEIELPRAVARAREERPERAAALSGRTALDPGDNRVRRTTPPEPHRHRRPFRGYFVLAACAYRTLRKQLASPPKLGVARKLL